MSEKNDPTNKTAITVAIIAAIAGIATAIITGIFSLRAVDRANQVQATMAQVGTQDSATKSVLQKTVSAPTDTPYPTFTSLPTYTPRPTYTPQATYTIALTPTDRPTNTPSLPSFSDDFENGIKPDWGVVYGDIGMVNGSFSVITPFNKVSNNHLAILNGYAWQNVRIRVSLLQLTHDSAYACDFPCGLESAAGIIIRYQPNGESIGFFILANSRIMALGTLNSNSEWKLITSTLISDPSAYVGNDGNHEFTIDAIGNTYTVFMNGKKLASASIPGITEGQVGLWFYNSNSDQRPGSYAPRYDSFEVQGLP